VYTPSCDGQPFYIHALKPKPETRNLVGARERVYTELRGAVVLHVIGGAREPDGRAQRVAHGKRHSTGFAIDQSVPEGDC
jgi:hypothetical protein